VGTISRGLGPAGLWRATVFKSERIQRGQAVHECLPPFF